MQSVQIVGPPPTLGGAQDDDEGMSQRDLIAAIRMADSPRELDSAATLIYNSIDKNHDESLSREGWQLFISTDLRVLAYTPAAHRPPPARIAPPDCWRGAVSQSSYPCIHRSRRPWLSSMLSRGISRNNAACCVKRSI